MAYWGYPRYVPVAEKRAKARKTLAALQKKNRDIRPVCLQGGTLARTWWGKAWNRNLERYADYENRIGRGRSYVRNGAVLDLTIGPGEVRALVQGSSAAPYQVSVRIRAFPAALWRDIQEACAGRLGSLSDLLAGRFPEDLAEVFMARGKGLFPSPGEIAFSCSCPDWASMCKHVAAALYGVGARLDDDPHLFFTLRNLNVESLITEVVAAKTTEMIQKAGRKTARVLDDAEIAGVFGIEMESSPARGPSVPVAAEKEMSASGKIGRSAVPAVRGSHRKGPTGKRAEAGPGEADRAKNLQDWAVEILGNSGPLSVRQVAALLRKEKGFRSQSPSLPNRLRVLLYRNQNGRFRRVGPGVFALAEKAAPAGGSETERVIEVLRATRGAFRLAEIQERCPEVSVNRIRRVLGALREARQVECLGRGRGARWRRTGAGPLRVP